MRSFPTLLLVCVLAAATPAATGTAGDPDRPTSRDDRDPRGQQTSDGVRGEMAAPLPKWMRAETRSVIRNKWQVSPGRQGRDLGRVQRPRPGPGLPAHRRPAPQGPADRLHERRSRTPYRPAEPDAGPLQAGRGRGQRRLLRHRRHRRAARRRQGPAARPAQRPARRLEQRVLLRPPRPPADRRTADDAGAQGAAEADDHQRQLALGPAGRDRRLQPPVGAVVRLPDHRWPEPRRADGADPRGQGRPEPSPAPFADAHQRRDAGRPRRRGRGARVAQGRPGGARAVAAGGHAPDGDHRQQVPGPATA